MGRPKTRHSFSATLFLKPTQLPRKQQRRIEHFWLFVLRCLIIIALALAFSRPFLDKGLPPPLGPGNDQRQTMLLIDRSASMRGEAWTEALAAARERIAEMRFGDNVALAVYDRRLEQVVGFAPGPAWNEDDLDSRKNELWGALSTISPSWYATYTGRAMSEAVELFSNLESIQDTVNRAQPEEPISLTRDIVLISDFQEGSDFSDWWEGSLFKERIGLRPIAVGQDLGANFGVHWVAETAARDEVGLKEQWVRVLGPSDGMMYGQPIQIRGLDGEAFTRVSWQGRESQIVQFDAESIGAIAVSPGGSRSFDDLTYIADSQRDLLRVIYLGDEGSMDSDYTAFYLEKAMVDAPNYTVQFQHLSPDDPDVLASLIMADWVIVASPLPVPVQAALSRQIERGLSVFLMLRDSAMEASLSALVGSNAELRTVTNNSGVGYTEIDFSNVLFAPFASVEHQAFSDLRTIRYQRIGGDFFEEVPHRVIARYSSGEPAWVDVRQGSGSIVIMNSSWDRRDSNWVLSPRFVTVLHGKLMSLRSERALDLHYRVGDMISAQILAGRSVIAPDGSAIISDSGADLILNVPGVYRLRDRGGVLREFVVNVDPQESRVAVLGAGALAEVGLSERQFSKVKIVAGETVTSEAFSDEVFVVTEQAQKLWKLIMWVVLGLFILEMIWCRSPRVRMV